uniref:Odorant binding protein 11 n=1 Tax=Conogethes pinicolalis TaxID=1178461 RepID=A0A5B9G9X3_9NEOP|nr:odorant binding protein 11 [Conogethes pinicolalis]
MQRVAIILVVWCVGFISAEKPAVRLDKQKTLDIMQSLIQCVAETNVNPEVLIKMRNGDTFPDKVDSNVHKFVNCAFVKTGYGKKNGHVKAAKMVDLFPDNVKEQMKAVVEKCDSKDGKDPNETTYLFFKCFTEESPVHVVLE